MQARPALLSSRLELSLSFPFDIISPRDSTQSCLTQLFALVVYSSELMVGSQEDAHELYQALLRGLSRDLVEGKRLRPIEEVGAGVGKLFPKDSWTVCW